MIAEHLRTEYLAAPLGLGIAQPRLYWTAAGGVRQSAYRVIATRDGSVVWDTGKVRSHRMTHIHWAGCTLRSRDRIVWSVTLWDETDAEGPAVDSWFELGLLDPADWKAVWITAGHRPRRNTRYPVDSFRRTFRISGRVRRARLYATATGIYEATLNGAAVGDVRLAPGSTDYRHRLQYHAFDVTDHLRPENALEVQLADGWYRGSIGAYGPTNVFGRATKLLCQLEILYDDGRTETIGSDGTFSWSDDGPVRFADLQDGEIVDARRRPTYHGRARTAVEKLVPVAGDNVVPREQERLTPTLITTPSGQRVLDFGQNIAGFIGFRVHGEDGQQVRIRLGEVLDDQGEFSQANFQLRKPGREFGRLTEVLLMSGHEDRIRGPLRPTPAQEIDFTCAGGENVYRTRFAVFGFRYALIETDVRFDAGDFEAVAVYSDMEQTGDFSCSNADVDRFLENTRWSMKGNFLDVPTDCPTRERLGWTGDAQVFFDTAAYLMDVAAFYRKWMRDVRDGQKRNGKSSAVVPYNGVAMLYDATGASVGWADAVVLVPYRFWKRYGDEEILREFYDVMRRYAMFMIAGSGPRRRRRAAASPTARYVYEKGFHLGEWLESDEFKEDVRSRTPRTEEGTAYFHLTMRLMAEIASVLGHDGDAARFTEFADGARRAYLERFLKNGTIDTDRQAKLVRPLALGLLAGADRRRVEERLVRAVQSRGHRVNTGFLSTSFLLPALTAAGRSDIAYRMLENEEAPGWLAEVKAGATTVWEDWDGSSSHNHYSPGAVSQWLFETVAGIRVAGENRFDIAPEPGGTLAHASASYRSIYGTVASAWALTGGEGRLTVRIPANTRATVRPPGLPGRELGPGTHVIPFPWSARTAADGEDEQRRGSSAGATDATLRERRAG